MTLEKTTIENNVLVSIGMPVYNGAACIRSAIASLLAQSFKNFELIISDNASTDNTREICENFAKKDARIKYHRQQINKGALANFDFVLQESQGEYFMWAAHDDIWSSNYIEECAKCLTDDPSISFIFPRFKLESIQLFLYRYIKSDIFSFVSSDDRNFRILSFLILHHSSHKCNIVYSFFRTNFILRSHSTQDISSDLLLGHVILSNGKGYVHKGILFTKRYRIIYPGFLRKVYFLFAKHSSIQFEQIKYDIKIKLIHLFPDLIDQISFTFERYVIHNRHKHFKICEYDQLPTLQKL